MPARGHSGVREVRDVRREARALLAGGRRAADVPEERPVFSGGHDSPALVHVQQRVRRHRQRSRLHLCLAGLAPRHDGACTRGPCVRVAHRRRAEPGRRRGVLQRRGRRHCQALGRAEARRRKAQGQTGGAGNGRRTGGARAREARGRLAGRAGALFRSSRYPDPQSGARPECARGWVWLGVCAVGISAV